MKVLKWIGMFLLWWAVGTIIATVFELWLAALGFSIGAAASGLIIILVLTIGLIVYGTRK